MMPPMEVPWPPMNLVAECTTMSAPWLRGWHRYGVASVLSTTSGICCRGRPGDTLEVEHVTLRVAQGLGEEGLGVGPDGGPPGVEVVGVVDEGRLDAELGQRVVEQVVGAAVERGRRDDVAAVLGQVQQGHGLGGLSAGDGQGGHTTFERGDPLLEDGLRRVHDPGVDVPELLQPEERRRVRGVAEGVARGLVDRHGAGAGGGVRCGTGVDLASLEAPVGHGNSLLLHGRRPNARRPTSAAMVTKLT